MKYFTSHLKFKKLPVLLIPFTIALTGCGGSSSDDADEPNTDTGNVITPPATIVDDVAPVITLIGESSVTVFQNSDYIDTGATANDNVDGTVAIVSTGTVNSAILGEYTLTYTATDTAGNVATATRNITVVEETVADITPPVITITGDTAITIFQNSIYVDEGASANDAIDGVISPTLTGDVNSAVIGDYNLTYSATDTAGNTSTAIRTVTVTPAILTGTAAGGAAIVGTVVVKGANGNVKSSIIEADGSYQVDVSGLTAPYRLRANGTVGGKSYTLHSYAEEASVDGTVNITPFTDLIVANTAQQLAETFFDSIVDTSLDATTLSQQESALQAKLQKVFDALGLSTAIDLLKTSFNADHSGLDAALDLITIETGDNNIATITNLLDNSSITDDITQTDDNNSVIEIDSTDVSDAVSDTIAIANLFEAFTGEFSDGLPEEDDVKGYFTNDFFTADNSLDLFLADILTDPILIGFSFVSLSVSDLDSNTGTATVYFNVSYNGVIDRAFEQWYVIKDDTSNWKILGDQELVDLEEFSYHCNDYNGSDEFKGTCGINTAFSDNDFTNNGTNGEPILSASVSLISGEDGTVKDIFYIGTPDSYSEGEIYNEGEQTYSGDWREFGTSAGQIDPSLFNVGDTVEYKLYQANLNLDDPENPAVIGEVLATYSTRVNYEPQTVGKYPVATQATLNSLTDFAFDEDLTIEWVLAEDTNVIEVIFEIDDLQYDEGVNIKDFIQGSGVTELTITSETFSQTLAEFDDFELSDGYYITVTIYANDNTTGQTHSTSYYTTVDATNL